jgi:DNA polymerase III alpha subunit
MEPNMKRLEDTYSLYLSDTKHGGSKWDEFVAKAKALPVEEDHPLHVKVASEVELMGFSIRGSPFEILNRKEKIESLFGDVAISYKDFVEGEEEVAMLPVVIKDFKERAQRNKQMMCFLKFGVETGEEFESPAFANIWKWIGPKVRKGSVYIATFHRKTEEPERLVIGKPGFAHSQHSCTQYLINVDDIEL